MITEEIYLLAKKVVKSYESKQLNKPVVMRCFPTIKQRNEQVDKQIEGNKHSNKDEQTYRQGFLAGYNWTKREFKKYNT